MAITAVHTLIYTDDAPATRAFLRDVLRFGYVTDGGEGQHGDGAGASGDENDWLIFGTGPSELGVHPTASEQDGQSHTSPRQHQITFMCDDLAATMAELAGRGATFSGEAQDYGFGLVAMLQVPGADDIMLYQPRHATAYDK